LFIDAIAGPKCEPRRKLKRWHGLPLEREQQDLDEILIRMEKLARRRALGNAGFEKSAVIRQDRPMFVLWRLGGHDPGSLKVSIEKAFWSDGAHRQSRQTLSTGVIGASELSGIQITGACDRERTRSSRLP
jgi:hypothetical protein